MIKKWLTDVKPGMILGKTIFGKNYEVLLKKGVVLTKGYIDLLTRRGYMSLYIEDEDTRDIDIKDPVSEKTRVTTTQDIIRTFQVVDSAVEKKKGDAFESIIDRINNEEIRESFRESYEFKHLCYNMRFFLEEIMTQDILSGLNTIKTHDNYTYEHSIDTAIISLVIAKRLCLTKKRLEQIAVGEFLHDIGKIFIEKSILNKPGELTEEEYNAVKLHPVYGYELLKESDKVGYVSAHIAYQHHERQDGMGYPRGLKGNNKIDHEDIVFTGEDKLILPAEIAAISDFYDACISDRPFRPALPHDLVYELIRDGARTQFNEELVNCFLEVTPKYLLGSEIRIKNGKCKDFTGYVVSLNRDHLNKPRVKLLFNDKKNKISPIEIDLSTEKDAIDMQCI
jgi:HD-GYP domain-containing protein (c-di-GMP phosphodiesterase class II)